MLIRIIFYLFIISNSYVNCRTYLASTSRQLRDYLRTVNPGDTIQLRDGLYSGNFIANRVGRSDAPIRLIGSQRSIISNNGGTGFYLTGQYWWLRGFTIRNSRKGIILQSARNNLLERLIIRDTDEEGIILRQGSTDNTIRNCFVTRTGLRVPDYGFGISIGSDQRSSLRGYVDSSNRNSILNNRLQTGSTAEAIHVYEGTCCGFIRDNNFDGRAILYNNNNNNNNNANNNRYNRCWVAINGNSYRIERNNGRYAAVDGFQVRMSQGFDSTGYNDYSSSSNGLSNRYKRQINQQTNGYSVNGNGFGTTRSYYDYGSNDYNTNDIELQGCNNIFRGNRCELNSNGYCIRVINPNRCRVIIYADNVSSGNTALTNVAITGSNL